MAVSESYLGFVVDQLAGIGRVRTRRMFGAAGLYADQLFFALLAGNTLYFKVGDANLPDFVARGMRPFCPFPDRPALAMGYYEVPADVIDDAEELAAWARKALRVAEAARRVTPPRRTTSRKKAATVTGPRRRKEK